MFSKGILPFFVFDEIFSLCFAYILNAVSLDISATRQIIFTSFEFACFENFDKFSEKLLF